jgi:hypothetical protein
VTVVLPTLNEEAGIGLVIDELQAEGYRNLLVVDGASTDRTVAIAQAKGVPVIPQRGRGKGGAVKTAIDAVTTPYLLVMDADHTYDPRDIDRLLAERRGCDEVIGMRRDRAHIPRMHRVGNQVLSWTLSLLMGHRVHDPCSGMYLLRTDRAQALEVTAAGFEVEAEIVGQLAAQGRIREVPITYRARWGAGKLRAGADGVSILVTIVKTMWLFNPVFLFAALAAIATVPGALILLHQLALRALSDAGGWSPDGVWLGLFLVTIGLHGLTVATITLSLQRLERRILETERRDSVRFPTAPRGTCG